MPRPASSRAFTITEVLVVIALVSTLISMLVPSLSAARSAARQSRCSSNLRQLGLAWSLYAQSYRDRAMPLAYTDARLTAAADAIYWFGTDGRVSRRVDFSRGFIAPFLDQSGGGVFDCPAQPWGSYLPQGRAAAPTSTYGYNGYYLSPAYTPGWAGSIAARPWRRLADIARPTDLLVFADTLLPIPSAKDARTSATNNALLDPPLLYSRASWSRNASPTTAFRHAGLSPATARTVAVHADGSVLARTADPAALVPTPPGAPLIGSVSAEPGAAYVPDWHSW